MPPGPQETPPSQRPTVAYVIANIHEPMHEQGWWGVMDAAVELDVNLVTFATGQLGVESDETQANALYALARGERTQGLIIHANSVNPHGDNAIHDRLRAQYQRLHPVSSAGPFAGAPYASVNQRHGVRDLVLHLLDGHHRRRIAYLRGPGGHPGAEDRYRGYCDALAARGLPFDPALVTPSTNSWLRDRDDIHGLLTLLSEERGLRLGGDIDAIVADSDAMAASVLDLLHQRGIHVPDDVAVVGFGDWPPAHSATPPLTTVCPPFYQKGKRALAMALDGVHGRPVTRHVLLPCDLIVRESCGCLGGLVRDADSRPASTVAETDATRLDHWRASLAHDLAAPPGQTFLGAVSQAVRQRVAGQQDPSALHTTLSALRRVALLDAGLAPHERQRAEDLWQQARVLIGEAVQRWEAHQRLIAEHQARLVRDISQSLITTFDVQALMDELAEHLPRLGIPACYVVLYDAPQPYRFPADLPPTARLVLGFTPCGRLPLDPDGLTFPTPLLLPEAAWPTERVNLVAHALYFRDEPIGYVLFGVGPREAAIYEVLRGHISTALKGALLFDETRRARAAAEEADLLKTRLLANVSHELRAPLKVIIGHTQEMLETPDRYGNPLPDSLLADIRYVHGHAEHQLRLINDLLDLSRAEIEALDLYPELVDAGGILSDAFRSIARVAPPGQTWRLEIDERLPVVRADPVRLRQIALNLLSNAAKFVDQGEIVLGVAAEPPWLHIWVRDTGIGIAPDLQARIFEPFVSVSEARRRSEGVGLGLAITRRLVGLHHGHMALDSEVGRGSVFHVYLPLPTLNDRPPLDVGAGEPALLLISPRPEPLPDLVTLAERRGLRLYPVAAEESVDCVLTRVHPVAVAWDLAHARPEDWAIVRRLHAHPQLSQLACLVYTPPSAVSPPSGLTGFFAKPASAMSLMEAIESLSTRENAGTILVVDDSPEFVAFCERVLADALPLADVRTAGNGRQAVAMMADEPPSLVLLDLLMPEMDGFDVLDWMRAHEPTRQTPVVVFSHRRLTHQDVTRLEAHTHVTFQTKGILTTDETAEAVHRALFGVDHAHATSSLVKHALAYVHQNYRNVTGRSAIADAVGVSDDYLTRLFWRELGITPWDYLKRYRILRAKELLCRSTDSVEAVGRQVGFNDPAYFSRVFRKVTGLSPSAYRDHPVP